MPSYTLPKINSIYSRFLHEESEVPFFTKAEGKAAEITAILIRAEESSFAPLVKLLKVSNNYSYTLI